MSQANQIKRIKLNTTQVSTKEEEFTTFVERYLVGQPGAVSTLGRAYRTGLNPIANSRRPIAVLIFAGPSRSGKSYSVEVAAEYCHGSRDAMVRIEGEEIQERHELARLVGSPPGYIGYEKPNDKQTPGVPTTSAKLAPANLEASRHGSTCPIVWVRINEVEKAHPALFDLLLGATDNGKLDLGNNQEVNLGKCVFVLTSNLGMRELQQQQKAIGFLRRDTTVKDVSASVNAAIVEKFRPEFRNRIDEVVVFNPLTRAQVRQVVDVEVSRIQDRILSQVASEQLFVLCVDEGAKDFILDTADNSAGGVADMKRSLKRYLEDPIGNELLKGTINLGDKVIVTREDGDDELSFYLERCGADITASEIPPVPSHTASSPDSHIFQRKLADVKDRASRSERLLFDLKLVGGADLNAVKNDSAELVHALKEVFGFKVVEYWLHEEEPFAFKVIVRGIEDQIAMFKDKYPHVIVTRRVIALPKKS